MRCPVCEEPIDVLDMCEGCRPLSGRFTRPFDKRPICYRLVDENHMPITEYHFMEWDHATHGWMCKACEVVKYYCKLRLSKRRVPA